MKYTATILAACLFACTISHAQTVGQRVKDRTVSNTNSRVDQAVDKTVDDAFNNAGKIFKKKDKTKTKTTTNTTSTTTTGTSTGSSGNNTGSSTSATSSVSTGGVAFSDFEPGQTVIFKDDFSQDKLADFPAKWNSNGSGKVTTLNGLSGRWLQLKTNTAITPEMSKALPENSTIEFDLYLDASNGTTPFIQFGLTQVKNILKEDLFYKNRFFMDIAHYSESDAHLVDYGLRNDVVGSKNDFPITSYANRVLHVSMALNKTRLRIYLDQTKVLDLPRVIEPDMRTNFFINSNSVIPAPELDMYIGNVRIASAETDARSLLIKQLMEDGKAVTNDILFDVNSDVIKTTSYAVINPFGDALKANPSLQIRITGHTDSDGNAATNMDLSKRRAAAVKRYLVSNYSIADGRIQTDGMGASQPVSDNRTASGKAMNRRVEFVKL